MNTTTWAVTTTVAQFEFDTQNYSYGDVLNVFDSDHYLVVWAGGTSQLGYAQVFDIDVSGTTYAITTAAASFNFDATQATYNSMCQVDTNHFVHFFAGTDLDGFAGVLEVNTTTWAVTTATTPLEFDTQSGLWNACVQVDANHFLNIWQQTGGTTGAAQVFTVNTTTWAVTTAAALKQIGATAFGEVDVAKVDTNHFIAVWRGADNDGFAQVLEVNTTTWAVTTAGTLFEYDASQGIFPSIDKIDDNHFIVSYQGADSDGFAQVLSVNTSTWAVTTATTALEYDTQDCSYPSIVEVDSGYFVNFWAGPLNDGFVQTLSVEIPAPASGFSPIIMMH